MCRRSGRFALLLCAPGIVFAAACSDSVADTRPVILLAVGDSLVDTARNLSVTKRFALQLQPADTVDLSVVADGAGTVWLVSGDMNFAPREPQCRGALYPSISVSRASTPVF